MASETFDRHYSRLGSISKKSRFPWTLIIVTNSCKVSFPIESWYQASQQGKNIKDVMVGVVRIKVKEARDLHPPVIGGTVNSFVVLYLGTQKKRTRVVHGSLHPVWSQSFEFFVQV